MLRKILAFAALSLLSCSLQAANVNLTWTHDQATCADGSPGANCPTTSYEVYQGSSATATDFVRVANGISSTTRAHTLLNVLAGDKCWYVIAISPGGASARSNIDCKTIPFSPPKAPVLTVTVQITAVLDGTSEPQVEVKTAQTVR